MTRATKGSPEGVTVDCRHGKVTSAGLPIWREKRCNPSSQKLIIPSRPAGAQAQNPLCRGQSASISGGKLDVLVRETENHASFPVR